MLKIDNLTFGYRRKRKLILKDFSLEIKKGGIYGLLGHNGVGKTTLLDLIMGALTPSEGSVMLNGVSTRRRLPSTLTQLFIVPEELGAIGMTLPEYASLYGAFYPEFSEEILNDCIREFDVDVTAKMSKMSMGQRKKAFICFALACNTPYLLLDEPTNGLDIPGKSVFRRLLSRYTPEDKVIIISTHQVRDLETMLDHVLIMNSSELLLNRSIAELQEKLTFLYGADASRKEGALASIAAPAGYDILLPADGSGEETRINLELLFEAAFTNSEALKKALA